jgi:hypothetical protein
LIGWNLSEFVEEKEENNGRGETSIQQLREEEMIFFEVRCILGITENIKFLIRKLYI